MTHPHSNDVSKIAETFERLAHDYPDGIVDMATHAIVKYGADEHCVTDLAGWFLLGTLDDPETDITWESESWAWPNDPDDPDVSGYARCWPTGETIEFEDGAIRLSKTLEFGNFREVEDFYENHPWVWGNHAGARLFNDVRAYGVKFDDTLTLDRIAKHWRDVADRTRQIEAEISRSGRSFDEVEDWHCRMMETA